VLDPTEKPVVWAVVPAAGSGLRFGGHMPKQFVPVAGVPLLHRTLRALMACPGLSGVSLAVPQDHLKRAETLPEEYRDQDRVRVCEGGASRTESVRAALARLPVECDLVLVHDGARPRVSAALVERVIQGALAHGACAPGIAPADTVKRVGEDGQVQATLDRSSLRLIQTPQGFRRDVLERAYAWYDEQSPAAPLTDDAGLVEAAGMRVQVVEGAAENGKLTTAADLARLGFASPRVGFGYDVHRLVEGRPLMLGGVQVPHDRGLLGHSDGDAAVHALCDALLGAAGLPDIGRLFPDSDPAYEGADSLELLDEVVRQVHKAGFRPSSADLTIVAQRPKLAEHLPAMAVAIAVRLQVAPLAVGVKATTEEGLGVSGQGQAIAAHAVAVLAPEPREMQA
jgi:2-C-methyl-D-erythritol 4-phosphate cytidylyltransferase/2-C-methyl-D-erythritol 2,4-cyclodiphosphate synthase